MTAELPWIFYGGYCHGLPWKSAGFHGKCHGSWHFHGKGHGFGHGTLPRSCPWQTPSYQPRQPTEIRGNFHGNAAITTEVRGSPQQLPRQFPRTFNRSNFHGHPRPSASIATAFLRCARLPRKSAGVRGYYHSTCRGSVRGKLRRSNHAHGRPGPWP